MRITELLDKKSIELNGCPVDKKDAITQMCNLMEKSGKLSDKRAYMEKVFAREEEGTTGIGEGIAIPHGKCDAVKKPGLAAMVIKNGVDFESLDEEPVKLIFLIAAPNTKENVHLDVLSKLSVLMMNEGFVEALLQAKTVEEFLQIIDDADEGEKKEKFGVEGTRGKLLAVTGCPTGIAHTYMAAEALEKAAAKAGCSMKVETRGSGGAKNVLTEAEIAEADAIIVAADTKVPMGRFQGKKLITCAVSDGISKAEMLIERALKGDAPIYKGDTASQDEKSGAIEGGSMWHRVYMHLMNGVSHMLPFVVGGGILIAIAFLIDGMMVDMNALPEEVRGNFGTITPIAAMFKNIGGVAFGLMLPVLAGYIAMSIGDRPGLAIGFVGGMIAASGTSGFLGALVAGFVAGGIVLGMRKAFSGFPEALDGMKPVLLYPLIGILLIGVAMLYVVEPVVGAINTALNAGLASMGGTSKILLGLILGGMMAVDLGGPVNKAAYVFGTASIAAGNYDIMAAVMIGGMVPPCGIALATLLFKNRFTKEEIKSGPTNFIMGLAFISEGAIPFAAADPLHVLPACIAGAAISGALSMAFGCTLMAPHGGIFVFPVVGNAILYLLSLVAGTVVTALLLRVLKKVRTQEA